MKITPTHFESELHQEMNLSDQSIRAEMISSGLDPDSEAEALRAMVAIAMHRAAGRGSAIRTPTTQGATAGNFPARAGDSGARAFRQTV